ncbi:Putative uncharacterized protein [Escherichia coli D6-117.29]|nr:Protein of unknown function [Escherichia coli]CDP77832.1 Putative uncharacterized protein [Escherichia coli D6-117.29]CDU39927.1 Protein of unknown function [Escherichia coli]
MKLPEGD